MNIVFPLLRNGDRGHPQVWIMVILIILCTGVVLQAQAQSAQPPVYAVKTIGIVTPPEADFTADVTSGTAPLTVQFTDISLHNPESWLWDFNGDDRIDDQIQNPEYTYREPGTYTVTLTVSNSAGKDEETKKGYIAVSKAAAPPVADFTADNTYGTAPLAVHFTDMSKNDPFSWEWDFTGDGRIVSKEQNPAYTYYEPGIYTVRLTVRNNDGAGEEVKVDYISILPPDEAEAPALPAVPRTETSMEIQFTPSITETPFASHTPTKALPVVENPEEPPDFSLLILLLVAAVLITGGYLYRRFRSSRQSGNDYPDLHLELSGGIDFGDVLPPVEDQAEALLPEKGRQKGGK